MINGSGLGVGRKDLLERPRGGAHEQLTDRIEPDIDASKRLADPSRPTAARVVERHHRTCLGEPVALDERHPPRGKQRLRPFPQRRAAGDAHSHPTTKRGGEIGDRPRPHAPFEPLIESRHAENHRRRQEAAGVEETPPVGNDVETAAADQRRGEIPRAGQRVAHRQPGEPDVGRFVEKDGRGGQRVGGQRPLRVDIAARPSGRPRGEEDPRRRVRIDGRCAPCHLAAKRLRIGSAAPPGFRAEPRRGRRQALPPTRRWTAPIDDTPRIRKPAEHPCGTAGWEWPFLPTEHDSGRSEPGDLVEELGTRRIGVERHMNDTGEKAGEIDDNPIDRMRADMDDPVTGAQARRLEGRGKIDGGRCRLEPGPGRRRAIG